MATIEILARGLTAVALPQARPVTPPDGAGCGSNGSEGQRDG
jgi:hypothetical protein